ncbi:MAG: DUF2383 domain-containing protein [Deltaproteobacteria bacterium]|nr:DUF2383 domain-containing protein [Nannocystaceae bacterium]
MTEATAERDVDRLNAMLRGERAAVETYTQCIEKLNGSGIATQLATLKSSHAARVVKLTSRINLLGGAADTTSGAWGAFAKLVEGGAAVFGEKPAIAALEEGEDHGKKDYADLEDLTDSTRSFVVTELVPEQKRTHDAMRAIKHSM